MYWNTVTPYLWHSSQNWLAENLGFSTTVAPARKGDGREGEEQTPATAAHHKDLLESCCGGQVLPHLPLVKLIFLPFCSFWRLETVNCAASVVAQPVALKWVMFPTIPGKSTGGNASLYLGLGTLPGRQAGRHVLGQWLRFSPCGL